MEVELSPFCTVGGYIARRITQTGAGHVFGVPGDYVLPFFDEVVRSDLDLVVTCNELNAGYAADGYARLRGVGAVAVTYDVGGFSLLNAVAGANAERVPLIVVSGAPRTTAAARRDVLHHSTGEPDVQYQVYRQVTGAAVRITDAAAAPRLIDEAVVACLRERRPCYIELPLDVAGQQCAPPGDVLPARSRAVDAVALEEAVAATAELIDAAAAHRRGSGDLPVAAIAGVEAHRLHAAADLQALVEHLGCPFVTTISSKSVLPETHRQFAGVYIGHLGRRGARDVTERAGVLLSLGALLSDLDLGLYTAEIDPDRLVAAGFDRVEVGGRVYDRVPLGEFLRALRAATPAGAGTPGPAGVARDVAPSTAAPPDPERPITVSRFYERMRPFIEPGSLVLADGGDSLLSASDLPMPEYATFLAQAFYASIGWSVPATLGALCAEPGRPTVTFVGDGAFQMTAQELSTIARRGQAPVMFVADNAGFVIERLIHEGPYNDVNPWEYARFASVVGGPPGLVVETEGGLERALARVSARPGELHLVQVKLARDDASEMLRRFGAAGH
jgi:TPP-dependent 2-oxoacid decarboxylase